MKKLILILLLACGVSAGASAAATASILLARQCWPWNGNIAVDFNASGVASGGLTVVTVKAYAGDNYLCTLAADELTGDGLLDGNGLKHLEFNPANVAELKNLGLV